MLSAFLPTCLHRDADAFAERLQGEDRIGEMLSLGSNYLIGCEEETERATCGLIQI
jgi:hypothetical protein